MLKGISPLISPDLLDAMLPLLELDAYLPTPLD